jgi:hypothetical protein
VNETTTSSQRLSDGGVDRQLRRYWLRRKLRPLSEQSLIFRPNAYQFAYFRQWLDDRRRVDAIDQRQ